MPTSLELREKRAQLIADARSILDYAESQGRPELNSDEQTKWDALTQEADGLKSKIETEERKEYQSQQEASLKESRRVVSPARPSAMHDYDKYGRQALRAWAMASSGRKLDSEARDAAAHLGIDLGARSITINLPSRALLVGSSGSPGNGANLVAPTFSNTLLEKLNTWGGMLAAVNVDQADNGAEVPYITWNDSDNIGEIVGEFETVGEADPELSRKVARIFKYSSKETIVSYEMMQDSAFDLQAKLTDAHAQRIGRLLNQHTTVSGNGTTSPENLVNNVDAGPAGAITYDNIQDLFGSIDLGHLPNSKIMVNPLTLGTFRKMKTSDGVPMWQSNMSLASPGTIGGYQYILNTDLPADVVLFGDFKRAYTIREVLQVEVHRLDELRARQGAVSFISFARYGGIVTDSSAVKRLGAATTTTTAP